MTRISTSSTYMMLPATLAPAQRKTTWAWTALVGAVASTECFVQWFVSAATLTLASPTVTVAAFCHSILICIVVADQLGVARNHAEAR